jgi:5-deoxy-5-amino-3-dehydroquinate synthase
MSPLITVPVDLGERRYDVIIGDGARSELTRVLPRGTRRVAIVTQTGIGVDVDPGVEHRVFTIANGEDAKVLSTIHELCSAFASWGLTRNDCVVGVGGGVVTDVAGFCAAVYHRGINVPAATEKWPSITSSAGVPSTRCLSWNAWPPAPRSRPTW